ncbi:hypothetical protein ABENE_13850 [Asticcacaulis benevestitus DSM 16100 = ATCC BAA-896]|uniref:Uncharacterized protein n=1 Tax=Asticcacaulis benevestitus DSM 16100 = ATCC BAA-896 TaxID=1121022 RepID=V4RDH0_9CAUL|nr:hypothetical protein [Asticcacaulis benevestitus]ESQ89458.1 hypothetical protein ABENE_13850 [Asticcacaulis benevestitus DSM 16100 = ATCC BAA-896]
MAGFTAGTGFGSGGFKVVAPVELFGDTDGFTTGGFAMANALAAAGFDTGCTCWVLLGVRDGMAGLEVTAFVWLLAGFEVT